MTDVNVKGGLTQETAILLLAAVAEDDGDPSVVRTTAHSFVVPQEIADKAGVEYFDPEETDEVTETTEETTEVTTEEPTPAKKAPAKKAAAKKTAASKE